MSQLLSNPITGELQDKSNLFIKIVSDPRNIHYLTLYIKDVKSTATIVQVFCLHMWCNVKYGIWNKEKTKEINIFCGKKKPIMYI